MSMNPRLLRPLATIDPDAAAWRSAVTAAGSSVSGGVVDAVSRFIKGCKSDGIWDAMKSVVLLAGADTLAGALAPLKGTAPTSYNFASGDYSKTSGLKGDGSTKYLDSNRANNADPQDDNHHSLYISTAASTSPSVLMGSGGVNDAGKNRFTWVTGDFSFDSRSLANEQDAISATSPTGFVGHARSAVATADYRIAGSTSSALQTSTTPNAVNVIVFARNGGSAPTNARLAFYSIGEAVDLALLDARVTALMTAIGVS